MTSPTSRRSLLLLPALALALACGDDSASIPADCTRDAPVRLISGSHGRFQAERAGDTTFFALYDADEGRQSTYAGPVCGADPVLLVDGATMFPTRVALDPADDDPTLVCDQMTNRHYRIDLTGNHAPQLLLPHLSCKGRPTKYGAVFIGGWGYLRLFSDFPDETSAIHIREDGGNDVLVLDEWIVYTGGSDLHAYAFATGETIDIPGHVLSVTGRGDQVLWYDFEDIATATLVDLRSNTATVLGTFDRTVDGYGNWDFDPSGQYIYHLPSDTPPRAFDLHGRPLPLPAPGESLNLADGGLLSVTRGDGQVHFTRPRDQAPRALDMHLSEDEGQYTFKVADRHLERIIDNNLLRIDLDGSPARLLASNIGPRWIWLNDHTLTTLRDGTLEQIDTTTNQRTPLATHVTAWQLIADEIYYLTADSPDPEANGLWYLRSATGVR